MTHRWWIASVAPVALFAATPGAMSASVVSPMLLPAAQTAPAVLSGDAGDAAASSPAKPYDGMSAARAVREGNRQLLAGDAAAALEAYRHAGARRPDALEVPFVEGLAHFKLGAYDKARSAFERAALSQNRSLADDAVYGMGACDHAAALEDGVDPQAAIEKLEAAMSRYQQVLADNPDHVLARDANYKAATKWRRIKQLLEQQQQQQGQQSQDDESDDEESQDSDAAQQQQSGDQDEQSQDAADQQRGDTEQQGADRPQNADQPQDADEQPSAAQQQQDDAARAQQDPAQAQPNDPPTDDEERAAAEATKQEADISKQQAENKLRAWMEQMRNRLRDRRKPQRAVAAPVDKDW
ncbi:MAG: hypothetical protein ACE5E6_03180 [Phycisphaerae bacterium]